MNYPHRLRCGLFLLACLPGLSLRAQEASVVPLDDLRFFQPAGSNWQTAAAVSADPRVEQDLKAQPGKGLLVNLPTAQAQSNLVSKESFGDLDLDFEFMMAAGSNSGIYLQGRYEIQLRDSWGKARAAYNDCGGIYERWDESRPAGSEGYEGRAPRYNACKAPGLWQRMRISFRAPRFDSRGGKTENARILRIELNGQTIHENVELTGPTRGPMFADEKAEGPLMIQGDHGPVAFRNLRYRAYGRSEARLSGLSYRAYAWDELGNPDFSRLKPDSEGAMSDLSWEVAGMSEKMALVIEGKLEVPAAGRYLLEMPARGSSRLLLDGKEIAPWAWWENRAEAELAAGEHRIEIQYAKRDNWFAPGLGLFIAGPGLRKQALHVLSSFVEPSPASPIPADAGAQPYVLRSFMDYPEPPHRIVHAVNVGSPAGMHYTFNADNGAIAQVWRGDFLDATPMWLDRGDGSARPRGALMLLGDQPALFPLFDTETPFPDSLPSGQYRFRGYEIGEDGMPSFEYELYGARVRDKVEVAADGRSFTRRLDIGPGTNLFLRVARGSAIEIVGKAKDQYYRVEGPGYFLKLSLPPKTLPFIRPAAGGGYEALIPAEGSISYTIFW
jgi:hypothetical protein